MLDDEENLYLFLQYGARSPVIAYPTGRPVFEQTTRAFRTEEYFGSYVSDPRPTKAEAKKQLDMLTIPFRIGAPFVPPHIKPIFVGAPRLAEFFIEIDPLDKFRD